MPDAQRMHQGNRDDHSPAAYSKKGNDTKHNRTHPSQLLTHKTCTNLQYIIIIIHKITILFKYFKENAG